MAEANNGQNPKQSYLYHGTSNTNPKQIYDGEEGFDMRFSNDGMWGQAIYFAAQASYSNDFAFKHEVLN